MARGSDFDTDIDWSSIADYSTKIEEHNKWLDALTEEQKALYELRDAAEAYNEELKAQKAEEIEKIKGAFEGVFGAVDKVATKVKTAYGEVSKIVKGAIADANAFFKSVSGIAGINGQMSSLASTLREVSSGTVGKGDLAQFFGSTAGMIRGAEAMKQQAHYARDLIAAYGDVNTAVSKYQNIMMLSKEDQKIALDLARQQAQIVEKSAMGQINSIKTQMDEAMNAAGQSILYTLKPIIEFLSQVAQAFKDISGFGALDDQLAAQEEWEANLTEEQKRVLELQNEMERLNQSGFLSSLDEVHAVGNVMVEASPDDEAEAQKAAEEKKQEALAGTNEKAKELAQTFYSIIQIVMEIGSVFSEIFVEIAPILADIFRGIMDIVSGLIKWLSETGALKGVLMALAGILAVVKLAQLAYAAAIAITKVAQAGLGGLLVAGVITAAVAVVAAGVGSALGDSGGGSSSISTPTSQPYGGTSQEKEKPITIYLDGKKVNDSLAESAYYDEEVVIR